jgi:hypothetical protein
VIGVSEAPKQNEDEAEKWWKTTLANIVGAFILVSAMLFFIWQKYTDGIMLLVGYAAGWFYGRQQAQQQ